MRSSAVDGLCHREDADTRPNRPINHPSMSLTLRVPDSSNGQSSDGRLPRLAVGADVNMQMLIHLSMSLESVTSSKES
jgi:hypothetical protein